MKRIMFVLAITLLAVTLKAQSVLGIQFGSSYNDVKDKLEIRFGSLNVIEDGGKITVLTPVIGEYEFKSADFYFQRQGSTTWLNNVFIQTWFSLTETERAKYMRDRLADDLGEKYNIDEYTNKQGYKCYGFGTNPKDDNEWLGVLGLNKDKGKDGKQRLYLTLIYGPIYYIERSADF